MTCHAPACNNIESFSITFEQLGLRVGGTRYYECKDSEYCYKHMLEQLDFLIQLVAEDEKINAKV